ncbi:hypothetical protein PHMEG_0006269 [Phytophthora megakarya]|uniref:Uncharacterized protein n=1 Tax=Phytophthora megakarya TaxID=4795 RepID=A0A225WPJ4_9STRA|nr:hypothetical protein PHMEG_0006269 [Phytophthora megakarya]
METRTQAGTGRPPRPRVHKPSHATWSTIYSPYATSVRASPRTAKLTHQEPTRPKRPLSASRVASTTSSRMAQMSPRPNSARPAHPNSASRARYMQMETIAFPMQSPNCEACFSPPRANSEATVPQDTDSTTMHMKLQALLEMWSEEQIGFRSSALFCETTFKQAKALAYRMPRPNAFISAVTFACLAQMGSVLDHQYPFLPTLIDELGAAVYSNFTSLKHQVSLEDQTQHKSALFFDHGKPWFQEMMEQKAISKSFQNSADASRNEILLLQEMLQAARSANSTVVSLRPPTRRELDEYYIPPVLQLSDLSVESLSEEVVNAFTKMSDSDARHLLTLLLENAAERDIPKFPDLLASTVGNIKGQDRRVFLRECFDYVTPNELQDALHGRDEVNDDKRYQTLVGDLHEMLQLKAAEDGFEPMANSAASVALFHSEEARIGRKVHELVELVEDVATEISFFEPKSRALLPNPLLERLRTDKPQCECTCGRHRLIESEEMQEDQSKSPIQQEPEDDTKKQKPRRKSTLKRPMSAPSGRRKNAICFNTRLGSPRKSSAFLHVFPLAEVCHLLSAILHLQFSRDAAEPSNSQDGGVSALMFDDRFEFLKQDANTRTFKTLAKDYLVRKYGIKSIAVMHTMQLERSLLHYSTRDNHVRCQLFSWFLGADKARSESKAYAFTFFQKLVKCILNLYSIKKAPRNSITSILSPMSPSPQPLAYSALITLWTECIGDGEPTNLRTIPVTLAFEACKQVFPTTMQRSNQFTLFREKLHRSSVDQKTIELEEYFRMAMAAWQLLFDAQMQQIAKTIETAGDLDADGFANCLIANGLEFTSGERYELFDLLTEDNENVIPSRKMAQLVMEAKYLKPVAPFSAQPAN